MRVQLFAQRQPLRHAKAVLFIHHRQAQAGKHHITLDDGMRAHHQHGLPAGHLRHHVFAQLAFAAAGEPGGGHAQRLQPAHQLAEMLFGQDLGGCHQRTLPARGHGHRRGQRGDHRLARSDIALQQPVHGLRARQVGGDFGHHTLLRASQCKRQYSAQLRGQLTWLRAQHRRGQRRAFGLGLRL